MSPTNEQIIAEAKRRSIDSVMTLESHIIEVVRENWTPPEPAVDPDLLAWREWVVEQWPDLQEEATSGETDSIIPARAYLAGARMAREQERERAKVLVECVERYAGPHAAMAIAKYRGEA